MVDINGRLLQEGDIIAYPVLSGLDKAKVLRINGRILKLSCEKRIWCRSYDKKACSYKTRYNELSIHNSYFYNRVPEYHFIILDMDPSIVDESKLKNSKKLIKEYNESKVNLS